MKIALVAEAGGGKDFLANHLIRNYGFTRYAFADAIRKIALTFFPEQFGSSQNKNRALLQTIGTKFREIDEDVWINALMSDIQKEEQMRQKSNYSVGLFVVTDCRMPNEYKTLKGEDFIFIRIKTDAEIRQQRLIERGDKFSKSDLKHHSESFLDYFECSYELYNNKTKEDAIAALDEIMANIRLQLKNQITEQRGNKKI